VQDLRNPLYRDAQVIVSGGTVRDIEIDGQSTGSTTGAFMLPTCKTINITYSVAPTLRWWLPTQPCDGPATWPLPCGRTRNTDEPLCESTSEIRAVIQKYRGVLGHVTHYWKAH
jgi:hypothetical protein